MPYRYDIFLSYPRAGHAGEWVHEHFFPLLRDCLAGQLPRAPSIFVDTKLEPGVQWPDELRRALLDSRLLVAVWTPPFFLSEWCMAEWTSMLAREDRLRAQGNLPHRGLVYPVVYSDGQHFDQRAKLTQYQTSLSSFTSPFPSFRQTSGYTDFHAAMVTIAQEIEAQLAQVPPWEGDWPIELPKPGPPDPMGLPQL